MFTKDGPQVSGPPDDPAFWAALASPPTRAVTCKVTKEISFEIEGEWEPEVIICNGKRYLPE